MSSTQRGYNRHKSDYYVTPQEDIRLFLKAFTENNEIKRPILDPCAGGDMEHKMSYPEALKDIGYTGVITADIREDSRAFHRPVDYLEWEARTETGDRFSTIITNPPFNLAQEIIEKALDDVAEGGHVIMLLRLNFFGSKKRFDFWKNNMPIRCYVHHKRMSFTDEGGTDSIEYMHCVWKKGENPEHCKLEII
jgi:hypothetical protein